MATQITTLVQEKGTAKFTVAFTDEDGNAVTPTAATWTLTDSKGNVINSRSAVVISSLSTSVTILLSGADLALSTTTTAAHERHLTIEYTYNSSAGSGLPGKAVAIFHIEDFVAVS